MSAADVFRSYLDCFTTGDLDGASALPAEDFDFDGPMLQARGRDTFLEGASGLHHTFDLARREWLPHPISSHPGGPRR